MEDFEDILRLKQLPRWNKDDPRLGTLHQVFEGYPSFPSNTSTPSYPSVKSVTEVLGGLEGNEGVEAVVNYLIDPIIRNGFLLDKQINAIEEKHQREGGYNEKLLQKRLIYRKSQS